MAFTGIKGLLFALLLIVGMPIWAQSGEVYGQKPALEKPLSLSDVQKNHTKWQGQDILFEGEVVDVCLKKGCWLSFRQGEQNVRVRFKGYSFFVPEQLKGQKVRIQGQLQRSLISIADQKHYLEDAGAAKEDIAKITADKEVFELIASGVEAI